MARTIGALGADLKSYSDYIYNASALPNNTNASSSVFQIGKCKAGVQLTISFDAETVVASTKTLKFELLTDVSSSGSFSTALTLAEYSAGTIAAGTTIRFVPTEVTLQYAKIKVTTTDDLSAKKITGYIMPTE